MTTTEMNTWAKWESLGSLAYNRRLDAYNDRVRSGVDRGNNAETIEKIDALFAELAAVDRSASDAADAAARAEARRLEDGE